VLLQSEKTMQEVHAVLLTGGSAYGLAAADGVMRFLEEHGIGYHTPWINVPIVPTGVIFDLNIGSRTVRPTAESGYLACETASEVGIEQGTVGVGTGATLGKWAALGTRMMGGFGIASAMYGDVVVSAAAVVNAVGDVVEDNGQILAGARGDNGKWLATKGGVRAFSRSKPNAATNTTLVVVMTNAKLSKVDVNRMAQRGHNGLARAIRPVHTSYDGDIVFGLASGTVDANVDVVAEMGAEVTAAAIRSGVRHASSAEGVLSYRDIAGGTKNHRP